MTSLPLKVEGYLIRPAEAPENKVSGVPGARRPVAVVWSEEDGRNFQSGEILRHQGRMVWIKGAPIRLGAKEAYASEDSAPEPNELDELEDLGKEGLTQIELGEPHPNFLNFLKEKGVELDPDNPFAFLDSQEQIPDDRLPVMGTWEDTDKS